jgi:hypothetical protein
MNKTLFMYLFYLQVFLLKRRGNKTSMHFKFFYYYSKPDTLEKILNRLKEKNKNASPNMFPYFDATKSKNKLGIVSRYEFLTNLLKRNKIYTSRYNITESSYFIIS